MNNFMSSPASFAANSSSRFPSTVSKKAFVDSFLKNVYSRPNLEDDVLTLLSMWDTFGDEVVDRGTSETGEKMRPVRVTILKTLLEYPHEMELEFMMDTMDHPALDLLDEARLTIRQLQHSKHFARSEEPTYCCEIDEISTIVPACSSCKFAMCFRCEDVFCCTKLNNLIAEFCERSGKDSADEEEKCSAGDEAEEEEDQMETETTQKELT